MSEAGLAAAGDLVLRVVVSWSPGSEGLGSDQSSGVSSSFRQCSSGFWDLGRN